MDSNRLKLFLYTIKYLKPIQFYYRILYFLRNKFLKKKNKKNIHLNHNSIFWKNGFNFENSFNESKKIFTFLNQSYFYKKNINWNNNDYGNLWSYNLNYFDFLNQKKIKKRTGLNLIYNFIENNIKLTYAKDPYPISLRSINWIKFLSIYNIKEKNIDLILLDHYFILENNLEYHLLGNHLLENAFSLLFGSYYFQNHNMYLKSKKLLLKQLNEQILEDGGHYELSPMYHQILFSRLLDCIQLIQLNPNWKRDELKTFLSIKAQKMNAWLKNITYNNGDIPMVNDSTYNVAPKSQTLFKYFKKLGLNEINNSLLESGYRKINFSKYELFIDVGNIGPDYQPGHSHSDTFNFEIHVNNLPVLVDTGISTYENNSIRQSQRKTESHNTVMISNSEQSEVWQSFRVARRAKISKLIECDNFISASHNGYSKIKFKHNRSFKWSANNIEILDSLNKSSDHKARAFFHFHSSISKPIIKNGNVILKEIGVSLKFKGHTKIIVSKYNLSMGFNKTKNAYKLTVVFDKSLLSKIVL